eukprot:CAMPEP_0175033458 /NCGR_PEP_ID=MMETSP0005-20121125/22018_1 /TAXON_ID=420556 /ORGANISM="Ochromonas sp., Strain CCMP1393" /LENGTH=241 /DNA_ID=CAMNT_0016294093 /DNA_START=61 /DNA_END=786 /DNA_ORIENTATION=+
MDGGRHIGRDDVVDVPQEAQLHDSIGLSGRAKGGRGVHLHQPGLQVCVDQDVVPVAFEAVAVVDHHVLHGLQRVDDHLVDALEQSVARLQPVRLLDVQPQVLHVPLASVLGVVILVVLLNRHIGEMNEGVVQVHVVVVVFGVAEAGKPVYVLVHLQRAEVGHEYVQTHVELLAAHEQRVLDVTGNDIGLFHRRLLVGPSRLRTPLLDLRELVDDKDTFTLGSSRWFHNPHAIRAASKLFHK